VTDTLDITSESTDARAATLSNFTAQSFYIDGIPCNSVEGFLQSLKVSDSILQANLCQLSGKHARQVGQQYNGWKKDQFLYWQNRVYPRSSPQYQTLLNDVYKQVSQQCTAWTDALKASYPLILTHTIGKTNPHDTVLTTDEFCSILTSIRLPLVLT
jgi:hypothetical protein